MYCNQCGNKLAENATLCSVCGKPVNAGASRVQPTPAAAPASQVSSSGQRIETHRTILGVLWILWGILGIVPALFMLGFGHFAMPFFIGSGMPPHMMHFWPALSGFVGLLGTIALAIAIAHIIAGVGLLQRQSWARVLALIVAFLALIHVPFGTVLGIYTIWVFLSADAGRAWEQASVS